MEPDLVDVGLALKLLTRKCMSLDELLEILFEHPEFQEMVRNDLKQSLFQLGVRQDADYVRGLGWKLDE